MKFGILAFWCALATVVSGYKVLVLAPVNGKSHWLYMENFVKEFVHRGHEVTCITSFKLTGPKLDNYIEILIDPPLDMQGILKQRDMFAQVMDSPFFIINIFPHFANISTRHLLSTHSVQEFIHRNDLHFDVIVVEDVYHDAFLILGQKYNAPVVTICPYGMDDQFDRDMGLQTPISHVSHTMNTYTDNMTFAQRWYNAMLSLYELYLRYFVHFPEQNKILNEYFGDVEQLPSIEEIRKNISLIFINAHRSIAFPRPSMPGLIYIGGAHIKPPNPLPSDLQQFLDESKHGVIYFSLGTIVNASKMPKDKLNVFLETFRKLKQNVLWKFEDESLTNVPSNVLIRKWLPQNDILAHPNIVLFISHGGMFSNFEAVNYGIQMLVIPFVGDQYRNALRVQNAGYGKYFDFSDINNESLFSCLNEMLTDNKYLKRAKEVSAIFNDNLVHPMDEFMFWIDYVIKFRGAKHLKSAAADMSLFTYLLLDVLLLNLILISIPILSVYFLIKRCFLGRKSIPTSKKQQ